MASSRNDIGRISQRIKSQMKAYQNMVSPKHWPYLNQVVFSLLKDPSVFVSQIARSLEGKLMPTEKRLLRMIHSPKMIWECLMLAHLKRLKSYVKQISFDKLLIYADLSDLTKPRARKMPDLDRVRDASESTQQKVKIKPGYLLNEIYVQFPGNKTFAAIFYPFSTLEKGFRSITHLVLDHMTIVMEVIGKIGIWISDRGYDNYKFFCTSSTRTGASSSV